MRVGHGWVPNLLSREQGQTQKIEMNQLTDYMQIPKLRFGRHRIYLAHVTSVILFFHIIDVQEPCAMLVVFVVCHTNTWIPRNHMIMYSQYGRLLEMYPRHLRMQWKGRKRKLSQTIQFGWG